MTDTDLVQVVLRDDATYILRREDAERLEAQCKDSLQRHNGACDAFHKRHKRPFTEGALDEYLDLSNDWGRERDDLRAALEEKSLDVEHFDGLYLRYVL